MAFNPINTALSILSFIDWLSDTDEDIKSRMGELTAKQLVTEYPEAMSAVEDIYRSRLQQFATQKQQAFQGLERYWC